MPATQDDISADFFSSRMQGKKPPTPAQPQPTVVVPDEVGADYFSRRLASSPSTPPPEVTGETPWSEVLSRGAGNFIQDIPRTAWDVARGIGSVVSDPKAAMMGLGKLEHGIVDHFQGEDTPEAKAAKAVGNQLRHDYLTKEGWKQGIAERPFSRLLDVTSVTAGPAAIASRTAAKAGATGVAKGINATQAAIDPAQWAVGSVKYGVPFVEKDIFHPVIGHLGTHTGEDSLNLLYEAGRQGGTARDAALSGMRAKGDPVEAVENFRAATRQERQKRLQDYQAKKAQTWGQNPQFMDATPVARALNEMHRRFGIHLDPTKPRHASVDEVRGKVHRAVVNHLMGGIYNRNPRHFTAEGFDDLKHDLDHILDSTTKGSPEYAAASIVRDAVSKEIKAKDPDYAEAMSDYEQASKMLRAYDNELSLSKDPDTALRKLFSGLRNNVTSNFWRRSQLMHKLAAKSPEARKGLYNIAGQTNSAWWPRGLPGAIKAGTGVVAAPYVAGLHPALAPLIFAAQSPRLMGEAALKMGSAARIGSKVPFRPAIYGGQWADHLSPFLMEPGDDTAP